MNVRTRRPDARTPTPNSAMARKQRDEREQFREMELWEHLAELRTRLVRVLVYVGLGAVVGWLAYPWLFAGMMTPLQALMDAHNVEVKWDHITDAFVLKIKVAVLTGAGLALPLLLGEIWGFVAPGLTRRERRAFYSVLPLAVLLFVSGCAIGYVAIWPALGFFATFLQPSQGMVEVRLLQNPSPYLMFIVKIVLAFGVVFQLPVVLMGLAYAGVVRSRTLTQHWRGAVVGMAALSALITPADVVTMVLLLVPLTVLYFGSIVLVKFVEVRRDKARAKLADATE